MTDRLKEHSTIGCCGIDCGLCPRFHTNGASACPGCCGANFKEKHPSCGVVTCCVNKRRLETCADCGDFPCHRFKTESAGYDSFVTHRRMYSNLDFIKTHGVELFVNQQKMRIDILTDFIQRCDDGRSKNFYCISCALLPIDKLQDSHRYMSSLEDSTSIKIRSKQLKDYIQAIANDLLIDLKLKNKK
jgi:hypothetical protein